MSVSFFWIPAVEPGGAEEELNRFLGGRRVLAMERHFVADGVRSAWAVAVECVDGAATAAPSRRERVDYREQLSPVEFSIFAALRSLRRDLASAEGVPPYALFTNQQLAAIVRRAPATLAELQEVEGVGEMRASKYGARVLERLREAHQTVAAHEPAPGSADAP